MRNILQYPVTDKEVLKAMENALNEYRSKGRIGGLDGYVLAKIKELLETDPEIMDKLVENLKIKPS